MSSSGKEKASLTPFTVVVLDFFRASASFLKQTFYNFRFTHMHSF